MKFGLYLEENQFPPWKNEYINYNGLKYFLKERQLQQNDGWTQEDENYFAETLIVSELDKVNGFIYMKTKQVGNDPKRISDLIQFIQINDIGFYKILKKHDKWTGISLLNSIRFRDIHHQFQSMMDRLQQQINFLQRKESTKELVEEEPVTTTTTKFWVHSDNLTEVQAILMFHLPPISQTLINTVYFDDPQQFTLYSNLLERNQKAEIIRARWYGTTNNNADTYFERKLHQESWEDNKVSSTKERFHILTNSVDQYLSLGHYNNNNTSKVIFQSMQKNRLKPTLRSYHHRTTYAEQNNGEGLNILLDNDLTFIKEKSSQTWRRSDVGDDYPFIHLNRNEVEYFPYAVLEIKTTTNISVLPQWLTDLTELLYEVPYFSKFLHGTSHFYRDSLPLLPWWLNEMELDIRRKSSYATIQSQTSSLGQCILIEPPLTPDYLYVGRGSGLKTDSNSASSFTVIGDSGAIVSVESQQQQLNQTQQRQVPIDHRSTFKNFMQSPIIVKIKAFKEEYFPEEKRADNYVSMTAWLYARITNDKKVLLSPQYAIPTVGNQQIMPKKGKLNKKKVEPKIFFANERTFISWLQFSALLLSVSLGLINFGDHISKASGGFFIIIAMILAGYAQLRFQYRAWQIRFRSDSRFDDTLGPAILCIVLVIALFVNLGLRLNQPIPQHPSPFGDDFPLNYTNSTSFVEHFTPQNNGTRLDKHGRVKDEDEDEA